MKIQAVYKDQTFQLVFKGSKFDQTILRTNVGKVRPVDKIRPTEGL